MNRYRRNKSNDQLEINKEKQGFDTLKELFIFPKSRSIYQTSELHSEHLDIYELNGRICINGFYVYGYVAYGKRCEFCNHSIIYDIDHGTDFCPNCNVWLFEGCSDPECQFCTTRPEKPLPDFGVNDDTFPVRNRGGWERYNWIVLDI